jgi:hypothetical protein
MNYQKVYDALCARGNRRFLAQAKRKRNLPYEDHHILPRSLGGSDEASNVARLTVREHWLAHRLLHKLHPKDSRMTYSAWRMANHQVAGKVTSRVYENLRAAFSTARKTAMQGNPVWSAYAAQGASARDYGKWREAMNSTHGKQVKCLETGEVFDTLTQAAAWLQGRGRVNAKGNKIGMCCSGKLKRAYAFSWRYV